MACTGHAPDAAQPPSTTRPTQNDRALAIDSPGGLRPNRQVLGSRWNENSALVRATGVHKESDDPALCPDPEVLIACSHDSDGPGGRKRTLVRAKEHHFVT